MFMRSPATGFNGPARNIAICLLHPLKPLAKYATTDRWPSGRRRTPGKCVGGEPSPGFESLSIRHPAFWTLSPKREVFKFFRYFRGL